MATRYFLFLTNCYHQPPQAASGKRTEPVVATVGVSHSPRRGKLPRARGGPTVSSAGPATKLKPARTQTQNGLLSTQPIHRKTSAFYSTIRVGAGAGRHQQSSQQGTQPWKWKAMASYSRHPLNAHTQIRVQDLCVCVHVCVHICINVYVCMHT